MVVDRYVGFGYGYDAGSWDHVRLYLASMPTDVNGGDVAGDRAIAVTTGQHGGSSAYEFKASLPLPCGPNRDMGLGETASEELSDTDCFRGWGTTEDLWSVTLARDTAMMIRVTSSEFTLRIRLILCDELYLPVVADTIRGPS